MTRGILGLRLDAPLMSFGGARIDGQPSAYPVPTRAMITGLLANALGYRRTDTNALQALQDGLRIGTAVLKAGREIQDHVATDLGRPHMRGPMWTTEGKPAVREGSAVTDVRLEYRRYMADADLLCAVAPVGAGIPDADTLCAALDEPARPLFIGRAACPPTDTLVCGVVEAGDVEEALAQLVSEAGGPPDAWLHLPADAGTGTGGERTEIVSGLKDWRLGVHAGQEARVVRPRREGGAP